MWMTGRHEPGTGKANTGKRFSGRRILSCVESGFLLVFAATAAPSASITHIPVIGFPEKERERLMEAYGFRP